MFSKNFAVAILLLLIGAVLQIILGEFFGFWVNFTLAALLASAFFVSFFELLVLILLAIFMLNWQPVFSYELAFIAGFIFLVSKARDVLPWHRWFSCALFTFLGVIAMYAIFAPSIFLVEARLFLVDALSSAIFSAGAFKVLKTT